MKKLLNNAFEIKNMWKNMFIQKNINFKNVENVEKNLKVKWAFHFPEGMNLASHKKQ